jgi:hypothetical protein
MNEFQHGSVQAEAIDRRGNILVFLIADHRVAKRIHLGPDLVFPSGVNRNPKQ